MRWISSLEAQEELERLCNDARTRISRNDPEAAYFLAGAPGILADALPAICTVTASRLLYG